MDDPRITWAGNHFALMYSTDDGRAGNTLGLMLAAAAVCTALIRMKVQSQHAIYTACLLAAIFCFCYQLKWQPWIVRLQLPLFLIAAPLCGLMIDRMTSARIHLAVSAFLLLGTLPFLASGFPRCLIGSKNVFTTSRHDQYFIECPIWNAPFTQTAQLVINSNVKQVGLVTGGDDWEYGIRTLLPSDIWVADVGVTNESESCPAYDQGVTPQLIIVLRNTPIPAKFANYRSIYKGEGIELLQRS